MLSEGAANTVFQVFGLAWSRNETWISCVEHRRFYQCDSIVNFHTRSPSIRDSGISVETRKQRFHHIDIAITIWYRKDQTTDCLLECVLTSLKQLATQWLCTGHSIILYVVEHDKLLSDLCAWLCQAGLALIHFIWQALTEQSLLIEED